MLPRFRFLNCAFVVAALGSVAVFDTVAFAQALFFAEPTIPIEETARYRVPAMSVPGVAEVPAQLHRQTVDYPTGEPAGVVIIDTPNTYLYYVLGNGKAIRYGIGVGREGFTWSGVQYVSRKAEWPDWIPPDQMIARQPYLPRWVAGGISNPLGARAIYLGETAFRIHGTNQPSTIGGHVSSGCIRMQNADVIDLYRRVQVGTKVIVLRDERRVRPSVTAENRSAPATAPMKRTPGVQAFGLY